MRGLAISAAALALFAAGPAEAHIVSSRFGDFYAGAAHPLTAIEDVALFVALGVVAGMQEARRARWMVVAFPASLLLGALLARTAAPMVPGALTDAAGLVLIGVLIAAAIPLPAAALASLAGLVGLFRGYANAEGLDAGTNVALFVLGVVTCGYALATLAAASALAFRRSGAPWRMVALRACGSWVAAMGLMFGAFAIRSL